MDFREPYDQLVTSPLLFAKSLNFPDPAKIKLYDCTLRDGEQMPGVAFSPGKKYQIMKALSDLGVHIAEAGFPSAAESERKSLQLFVQGRRKGELREDLEFVVACRCNHGDVDATQRSLEEIGISPEEVCIAMFTSASDLHLKYKIGRVLLRLEGKEESDQLDAPLDFYRRANIHLFTDVIRYARQQGFKLVQVVAEDVSRADPDYVVELFRAGIDAGGFRPTFTDTVGCGIPPMIEHYARKLVQGIPDEDHLTHFHNDYGLGAINTITALGQGMTIAGVGINGLGERAGNAPLHQVVAALRWLYGIELPGFRYDLMREVSALVERLSGVPVSVHEPVIGEHVFCHESGIHTAGVLIDPRIYEVIPCDAVGGHSYYLYGKHSGTQIVQFALARHADYLASKGVNVDADLIYRVTEQVKRIREEQAHNDHAEKIVAESHRLIGRLGLTAKDVAEIAVSIAGQQQERKE
ncbi:MAG: hypothetical protein M1358_23075 [Chloroflexi bacterium]|nr:hypothetical protein [Chloroflexota bacterium]